LGEFVCSGDRFARGSVIRRAASHETSSIDITRRSRIGAFYRASSVVAPVVPLNEPGVRRAGTGVCFSGGENRSRGEAMGVAIGCEGAWPWEPPADPGPGVGCAEGARWFRGLRRGDRRGTDEGGPMGAGVICAASSPPAVEVVRGCAQRVGQGLLGVPRSSDPRVTETKSDF
jgi:hypothetical protein